MKGRRAATDVRGEIARYMRDLLRTETLCWESPGPEGTVIDFLQCWAVPPCRFGTCRLIIVAAYEGCDEFELFPQIRRDNLQAKTRVLNELGGLEQFG